MADSMHDMREECKLPDVIQRANAVVARGAVSTAVA